MAWKATCAVGERRQLLKMLGRGMTAGDAADLLGISRKTAQKWKARARDFGLEEGLKDRSRARKTQDEFSGEAMPLLLKLREEHPNWGPVMLRNHLLSLMKRREVPRMTLPAASTLGAKLKAEGMVRPRRRQRRYGPIFRVGDTTPTKPNDRWTIDFKGQFRLGNGEMCFPLTLRDAVSRMVLRVDACRDEKTSTVLPLLESAFEEYGLPGEIHSDTGVPFGSTGLGRLSELSIFVLKQGIRPVFSRPGKPQDNGGHERMHRDLKAETTRPPAHNARQQQARFDAFREYFNNERPHRALDGETPASRWQPSSRHFDAHAGPYEYPGHWETRSIDVLGKLSWRSNDVLIAKALRRHRVGLEPLDEGLWCVRFMTLPLGLLSEGEDDVVFFS